MKKYLIIGICLILTITGCSNKKEEYKQKQYIKSEKATEEKTELLTSQNLITDQTKANNEEEIVNYIEDIEQKVSYYTNEKEPSPEIKEKLKNTFITLTDFIFYKGTIKGVTFDELSTTSKEKILNIINNIDTKIESVSPGYKETVNETAGKVYTNIKEKTKILKEEIINNYEENVKEETKSSISSTYETIKEKTSETADIVSEDVKNKYETIKEKANNWYKNFKESSD